MDNYQSAQRIYDRQEPEFALRPDHDPGDADLIGQWFSRATTLDLLALADNLVDHGITFETFKEWTK